MNGNLKSYERISIRARFENETNGNLEMAYYSSQ